MTMTILLVVTLLFLAIGASLPANHDIKVIR